MKEYFLIGQRVVEFEDKNECSGWYVRVEEYRLSIGFFTDEEKEYFERQEDILEKTDYALRTVADIIP